MPPSRRLVAAFAAVTIGLLTLSGCGFTKLVVPKSKSYSSESYSRFGEPRTFSRSRSSIVPTTTTTTEFRVDRPSDSPIYHSSQEWGWLTSPGQVIPGGQMINITHNQLCSVGWIVGVEDRRFILTAGHCGKVRDQFAISDGQGNRATVGEMVESTYIATESADYGLIELYSLDYVRSTPPFTEPLVGWRSATWLDRNRPRVCHLGLRTGQSCGDYIGRSTSGLFEFRGYVDHGDSGGPVYSLVDGELYAVGITSYRQPSDATRVGVQDIGPAMERWGLKLYG